MKKYLLGLLILLVLSSCYKKGTYQYQIYMKDGRIINCWQIENSGAMVDIIPPIDEGAEYYLSPGDINKIIYVGLQEK